MAHFTVTTASGDEHELEARDETDAQILVGCEIKAQGNDDHVTDVERSARNDTRKARKLEAALRGVLRAERYLSPEVRKQALEQAQKLLAEIEAAA